METKTELAYEIEQLLAAADESIREAQSFLISQGELVDLTEWVTIKEYCSRFNIRNVETVVNWINRGIISPENVRTIEEFNHTRLIKAIPYNTKSSPKINT
ncbi:hypothetical protein [Dyadobacter sp. Leaf189]|uniref:hypothetical protein n=1 Tax=Dyadobacter sp. Leaf189 TaxID=1736295 RepID=UPI000A53C9A8|nr:hypothetical protein [Dyadobacter sp. Leaf189]